MLKEEPVIKAVFVWGLIVFVVATLILILGGYDQEIYLFYGQAVRR